MNRGTDSVHDRNVCLYGIFALGSLPNAKLSLSFNNTQFFYSPKDDDYLCKYTIKKYHSDKNVTDDSWVHSRIELLQKNTDGYSPVVIDDVENYRVLGVLRHVITD